MVLLLAAELAAVPMPWLLVPVAAPLWLPAVLSVPLGLLLELELLGALLEPLLVLFCPAASLGLLELEVLVPVVPELPA